MFFAVTAFREAHGHFQTEKTLTTPQKATLITEVVIGALALTTGVLVFVAMRGGVPGPIGSISQLGQWGGIAFSASGGAFLCGNAVISFVILAKQVQRLRKVKVENPQQIVENLNSQLRRNAEDLNRQLKEKKEAIELEAQKKVTDLQDQLNSKLATIADLERMEIQLKIAENEKDRLISELKAKEEALLLNVQDLEKQNAEFKSDPNNVSFEVITELGEAKLALNNLKEEIKKKNQDISTLKATVFDQNRSLSLLWVEQMFKCPDTQFMFKTSNAEKLKKNPDFQKETLKFAFETLKSDIREQKKQIQLLEEKLKDARSKPQVSQDPALETELKKKQEKIVDLTSELVSIKIDNSKALKEIKDLKEQIESLKKELESSKTSGPAQTKLQEELEDRGKQIEDLTRQVQLLKEELKGSVAPEAPQQEAPPPPPPPGPPPPVPSRFSGTQGKAQVGSIADALKNGVPLKKTDQSNNSENEQPVEKPKKNGNGGMGDMAAMAAKKASEGGSSQAAGKEMQRKLDDLKKDFKQFAKWGAFSLDTLSLANLKLKPMQANQVYKCTSQEQITTLIEQFKKGFAELKDKTLDESNQSEFKTVVEQAKQIHNFLKEVQKFVPKLDSLFTVLGS